MNIIIIISMKFDHEHKNCIPTDDGLIIAVEKY